MSGVRYRRRGTAIVETERGILLTAGQPGKPFILPGGGAKRGETVSYTHLTLPTKA